MAKRIGIIGGGIAGLHLGLYLRQHDVAVTMYTDRRPEDYAKMRLLNTAAHHWETLKRETALNIDHWPEWKYGHHRYYVNTPDGQLQMVGSLAGPSRLIDHRIYLPRLMEDFMNRGGEIEYSELTARDIPALAAKFDMLVVCTGKGPLGQYFQHQSALSPFDRPQRQITIALYKGVAPPSHNGVGFVVTPGVGEIIDFSPMMSFGGNVTGLAFLGVAGSDYSELTKIKYEDSRDAFIGAVSEKLRRYHPSFFERIDHREFDLANGPLDVLQGGVTPTVRNSHAMVEGKLVVALGDVHVLVDPVMAQGANLGSHGAWVLGEEIVANETFDEAFIARVDERRNERLLGGSHFTNYMLTNLKDPPPEFVELLTAMHSNRAIADELTGNFAYPEKQWSRLSSPENIRAWIEEKRSAIPAKAA